MDSRPIPRRVKRFKRLKAFAMPDLAVQQRPESPIANPNLPVQHWNKSEVPLVNPNLAVQEPPRRSQRERKRPRRDEKSETELWPDIADGLETYAIPVRGPHGVQPPLNFRYINEMRYGDSGIRIPKNHTPCSCVSRCGAPCACSGSCVLACGSRCACLELNGAGHPYVTMENGDVRLHYYRHVIFECHKCNCDSSCDMRLSQEGGLELEVFHTGAKGFGVRSPERIPQGARIGEYLGDLRRMEYSDTQSRYIFEISCLRELRQDVEAAAMGHHVSGAAVGSRGEDLVLMIGENEIWRDVPYNVDAFKVGNVTRFINHSCSPNTFAQAIVYPTSEMPLSAKLARIVIFASKEIEAWEEITIDYNPHGTERTICQCASDNCRKDLWF